MYSVMRDEVYGDHERHRLDVYVPAGGGGCPVVVFVHGGGWQGGDKSSYEHLGGWLAGHGIMCAMMNYRLTPEVRHPGHVTDVAAAVSWLYGKVGGLGGSLDRLYLTGYSAGGHLAALLALDESYLGAHGLNASIFKGVVTYSGVYEIDSLVYFIGGYHCVFPWGLCHSASPLNHVRGGLPPWVIIYGTKDFKTLDLQAKEFYRRLREAGCEARLQVLDSDHPLLTENLISTVEAIRLIRFFKTVRGCESLGASGVGVDDHAGLSLIPGG